MSDDENDKHRDQNRQALIANAIRTAVGAKAELAKLLERVSEISNGWIDSDAQKVEAVMETAEQRDRLLKESASYAERYRDAEVRNEELVEDNADLRDKVERLEKQLSETTRSRDGAADDLRFLHSALINMDERAVRSFSGGYKTESELEAFRHGMTTICNAVRGTFGDMVVRRYAAAVDAAPGTPPQAGRTSLVVEDRSAEPSTSGDEPDPAHMYVDPSGTVWYRYTVEFVDHGASPRASGAERYDFDLWATSDADAERRMNYVRHNARVVGRTFKRGSTLADVTEPNRRRGTS